MDTPSDLPAASPVALPGGLLLALAMTTVGSTVVASRIIVAELPPFTAAALRFAIALPIFLVLMRARGERPPRLDLHDGVLLVLQSLCGSVGYSVLMMAGMRSTSASTAGVILGAMPAVAALVGVLVLRERPGRRLVAAITMACLGIGVAATCSSAPSTGHDGSAVGNLLVLGAVACEAIFLLLNKRLRRSVSPMAQSTLMCALGLAMTVVPAGFERAWGGSVGPAAMGGVLYYALVPTVGGYLLWYAGTARVNAGVAALYTAVMPVSALCLASLVLHERVGASQLAGVACIVVAIALCRTPARGRQAVDHAVPTDRTPDE